MSEKEEFKEHFNKIVEKIHHHHEIREHDKKELIQALSTIKSSWLSALDAQEPLPLLDLTPFDQLNTKESKPYKKLAHDTAKAVKKMYKEYEKHHPEIHREPEEIQEAPALHIVEEEKFTPPPPTDAQRPSPLILETAVSKELWEQEKTTILAELDREHCAVKLCYLAYALISGTAPYLLEAQETLIQECGRRVSASDMQLNVTDIKPLTAFVQIFEHIIKQLPTLSVPLRQMVSGLKSFLGE